ncbi:unnamed protein product [Penicillium discolor]
MNQGRWEEAEQLEVQVMETRKMTLGGEDSSTLTSMANLASTYRNQGRWEEAEQFFIHVMETSRKKLGEDHPSTLTGMANLASTYMKQGRWEEAEQLDVQVMQTSKTKLGEDHPDTLSTHKAEAIILLRDCLTKQKQTHGLNHPITLSNTKILLEWEAEGPDLNA